MILALALASAPVAAMVPAPEVEQEIVVIGFKFKAMKFKADVSSKDGVVLVKKCRVTKSSKDKEIDAIGCDVTRQCVADKPATPEILAGCIETRSGEAVAALAERRVTARNGS